MTDEDQSACTKPSTVLKTCTLELLSTAKGFTSAMGLLFNHMLHPQISVYAKWVPKCLTDQPFISSITNNTFLTA